MLKDRFWGSTHCNDQSGAEAVIFGAPTDKAGMPVQTFRDATSHAQAFCAVSGLVRLGMRR